MSQVPDAEVPRRGKDRAARGLGDRPARFDVADGGISICEPVLATLFEQFSQGRPFRSATHGGTPARGHPGAGS